MMKLFIQKYEDAMLIAGALVLGAILLVFFFWSVAFLASRIADAIAPPTGQAGSVQFRLEEAKTLDLRGLKV